VEASRALRPGEWLEEEPEDNSSFCLAVETGDLG